MKQVFIKLADEKLLPLIPLSPESWAELDRSAKIRAIPCYIDPTGTEVWPEPSQKFDLFTLSYYGTVGVDGEAEAA